MEIVDSAKEDDLADFEFDICTVALNAFTFIFLLLTIFSYPF